MNKTSITKNYYSKTQYFFWLLSGAEISILKNCPTDFNRQAGIGFTVFMTTLLAFCSGSYAGYYFGESFTTAILFGIIWASLIFSIDRSMIVTLKKDPTKEKQDFWSPLLSRAILATLIAFIISIPLELLIFKENIKMSMPNYKVNKANLLNQAVERNQNLSSKERMRSSDSNSLNKVGNELIQGEPKGDPDYTAIITDLQIKQNHYNELKNIFEIARKDVPESPKFNEPDYSNKLNSYNIKKGVKKRAYIELNKFDIKYLNPLKQQKNVYIKKWSKGLVNQQTQIKNDINLESVAIKKSFAVVNSSNNEFVEEIKDKKGFVLSFMVLESLATRTDDNPEGNTIFMLLWLIRILFFTIEILPTIAKISTPLGAYDRAIYRKENDLELELDERTSGYLAQQKILRDLEYKAEQEQTMVRTTIENKLHNELLTEIATVQDKVARQKILEFKQLHLKSV